MAKAAGKPRKKLPKELAVIRADNCTGCDACIEVCPVDCIYKVPGEDQPTLQHFCDIDLERCIGCAKCVEGCNRFGNGSLFLQIRHDRCVHCNECAIARTCPTDAFRRVPASQPYLLKTTHAH